MVKNGDGGRKEGGGVGGGVKGGGGLEGNKTNIPRKIGQWTQFFFFSLFTFKQIQANPRAVTKKNCFNSLI